MKLKKIALLIITFVFINNYITSQEEKKIIVEHSDSLVVNEITHPNIKKLYRNVILKHENSIMECDSAYYNTKENVFYAFSNVHITKPHETDTVHLYGDSLRYSGNERLAEIRKNVIINKDSMVLITENMDYDLNEDVGYYFDGGVTHNGEDTLISKYGYYYSRLDELYVKDSVEIRNPKYTVFSDTLKHNLSTKVSFILGPTEIISEKDSNYIYCENGWYDHNRDVAQFNENSFLRSKEHTLNGDSLYYDRNNGYGEAFRNVEIKDTVQNMILKGNHGEFNEFTEYSMMTDSALFIQIDDKDSLFLHADTLISQMNTIVKQNDTTTYRIIKAYNKVKLFRRDFQAKCDSLIYSLLDSTIEFRVEPVMWSEENQITADFIKVFTINNEVSKIDILNSALIVSQADSIRFNQVAGKDMIAHVNNNKLYKIEVKSKSKTIYFPYDKKILVGVNKIESNDMIIYMKNNKVDKIWFYQKPVAVLYPPLFLNKNELKLKSFKWLDKHRPRNKDDIFYW